MDADKLSEVRSEVAERLASGEEPPWAWFNLMKLQEALDQVLEGLKAVSPQTGSLQQSDSRQETLLQLVDSKYLQDTSQRRSDSEHPQLPM